MIDGKTANEIFDSIRQHVATGTLAAGETLPPVRELATALNVNRNTVAAAYKRLVTSGLAQSQGRNGTVIKGISAPLRWKAAIRIPRLSIFPAVIQPPRVFPISAVISRK